MTARRGARRPEPGRCDAHVRATAVRSLSAPASWFESDTSTFMGRSDAMCGGSGAADGPGGVPRGLAGALGMPHRGDPGAQRRGEDPSSGGVHGGRAAGRSHSVTLSASASFGASSARALSQLECLDPFSEASGLVGHELGGSERVAEDDAALVGRPSSTARSGASGRPMARNFCSAQSSRTCISGVARGSDPSARLASSGLRVPYGQRYWAVSSARSTSTECPVQRASVISVPRRHRVQTVWRVGSTLGGACP